VLRIRRHSRPPSRCGIKTVWCRESSPALAISSVHFLMKNIHIKETSLHKLSEGALLSLPSSVHGVSLVSQIFKFSAHPRPQVYRHNYTHARVRALPIITRRVFWAANTRPCGRALCLPSHFIHYSYSRALFDVHMNYPRLCDWFIPSLRINLYPTHFCCAIAVLWRHTQQSGIHLQQTHVWVTAFYVHFYNYSYQPYVQYWAGRKNPNRFCARRNF